jgi:hypothetical protein
MKATKNKKYVTLKDSGCDFRKISVIMTKNGYKMNHATVRNLLLVSIKEIFSKSSKKLNSTLTDEQINLLISNQEIQESLGDVIYRAYTELKEEKAI